MPYSANLVPTMTSATAPSGEASASGNVGGQDGWHAFDHLLNDGVSFWLIQSVTCWLQYQFAATHAVTKYRFLTYNGGSIYAPTDWTFEGSNDGVAWDVLDTQAAVDTTGLDTWYEFEFVNTTQYDFYRINITAGTGVWIVITELEMFESTNVAPVANAGTDDTTTVGATYPLNGSASDDDLPLTPGALSYLWTKTSGPGTATFVDDTDPTSDVVFSAAGTVVLNLNVSDGDLDDDDTVSFTVAASEILRTDSPLAVDIPGSTQGLGLGLGLGLGGLPFNQ